MLGGRIAQLCVNAGADIVLINDWIDEGRAQGSSRPAGQVRRSSRAAT
jgi:hypothetical protein